MLPVNYFKAVFYYVIIRIDNSFDGQVLSENFLPCFGWEGGGGGWPLVTYFMHYICTTENEIPI